MRSKEYEVHIRFGRDNTTLVRGSNQEPIDIRFHEMEVIAPFGNQHQALIREALEIEVNRDSVCNEFQTVQLPRMWQQLLWRFCCKLPLSSEMCNEGENPSDEGSWEKWLGSERSLQ